MDSSDASSPALDLGPGLTIVEASQTHMRLLEHLAQQPGDLSLDLGELAEFDSAGLQLLLSLRAGLEQQGARLTLLRCSPLVDDALAVYGLGRDLRPLRAGHQPEQQ